MITKSPFYWFVIQTLVICVAIPAVHADLVEVGSLNNIQQAGNSSNGLSFLDMSHSVGKTEAQALADAQLLYADARLATQSEWNDLFQAVDIAYTSSLTASDAFSTGIGSTITSTNNAEVRELIAKLGATHQGHTLLAWSDPDGSTNSTTTRDVLTLEDNLGRAVLSVSTTQPASPDFGWLIVTSVVPEPSSAACLFMASVGMVRIRSRRTER
ncbi:MAG: hypothetical protein AAF483_00560 [Planctomycetota bacterium]